MSGGIQPMNFVGNIVLVDGCNNQYTLYEPDATGRSRFVYKPITPIQSSSGRYSGGEPGDVQLTSDQVNQIRQLFAQTIQTPSDHATQRHKGVAILIYQTPEKGEKQEVLINFSSQGVIIGQLKRYFRPEMGRS